MGNEFRIKIQHDSDSEGPREWDNLGTFVGWHRNYRIGDAQPSEDPEEYLKALPDDEIILNVYMYEHSGVAYSTSAFGCAWDSGQVGFIHCNPSSEIAQGMEEEAIKKALAAEVEVYSTWANGEVYGYTLEEFVPAACGDPTHGEWEHFDSCWGFYGMDWETNGMMDNFPGGLEYLLVDAEVTY